MSSTITSIGIHIYILTTPHSNDFMEDLNESTSRENACSDITIYAIFIYERPCACVPLC